MSEIIERRYAAGGIVEATNAAGRSRGGIATIAGYASVFGSLSHDLGGWRERIEVGAFKEALAKPTHPILALYDHAVGHLLASVPSGTLRLREDQTGLRFEIDLPDTTLGRDVLELVRRGDLAGASFGFVPDRRSVSWEKTTDGVAVSVVGRVKSLREVSIVALPAYAEAGRLTIATRPASAAQERAHAAVAKMRQAAAIAAAG